MTMRTLIIEYLPVTALQAEDMRKSLLPFARGAMYFVYNFSTIITVCIEVTTCDPVQDVKNLKILSKMSLLVRNPVFGVSDQVRHKPVCTVTKDG